MHDKLTLIRTIGERMKQAREMCNMSQKRAAASLGYETSAKLSKIEHASDTASVPIWIVTRAAALYQVSCDWILGLTDDWETKTVKREATGLLGALWDHMRERDAKAVALLNRKIRTMEEAIATFLVESASAKEAMEKFVEMNPGFDEYPAGARLLSTAERVSCAAYNAKTKMDVFNLQCRGAVEALEKPIQGHLFDGS